MRIVFIEIQNFRGIKQLEWAPGPAVNCLIGRGDSTKTTILDAIELTLNPRSYLFADDSDFYDLDFDQPVKITVTLSDLPGEFLSDDRYGMYLRGWDSQRAQIEDESGAGLEDVLSVRVTIDKSLEARWSIFNERIDAEEKDPPSLRYADARKLATTRLGPYAERHLGWGRQSVLTRIDDASDNISAQLAEASRAARNTFQNNSEKVFENTVKRAEELGKQFAVPVREKYSAQIDVQNVSITAGGLSIHDGKLPLRRLGTGSSRLLVSALQHDTGASSIALIDEIEHGLEPHRIARLLKYLKLPTSRDGKTAGYHQLFMTTHSPVVIRELSAKDIFTVRSEGGTTKVCSVAGSTSDPGIAQRHLRRSPEAFLARKVLVGEGRTELGLLRGLDNCWSNDGQDSMALRGAICINGEGNPAAGQIAEHLLDLGYEVLLLIDTDIPLPADLVQRVKAKDGKVCEWPDSCSTEERVFLDVPWETVIELIRFAENCVGPESVKARINAECQAAGLAHIMDLTFPAVA